MGSDVTQSDCDLEERIKRTADKRVITPTTAAYERTAGVIATTDKQGVRGEGKIRFLKPSVKFIFCGSYSIQQPKISKTTHNFAVFRREIYFKKFASSSNLL